MEKANVGNTEGISRRLSAVKVVVDLFNHELDLNKADKAVNLERERLVAMVTTLEMFIGDVEGIVKVGGPVDDRRVVEAPRATASRIN